MFSFTKSEIASYIQKPQIHRLKKTIKSVALIVRIEAKKLKFKNIWFII